LACFNLVLWPNAAQMNQNSLVDANKGSFSSSTDFSVSLHHVMAKSNF